MADFFVNQSFQFTKFKLGHEKNVAAELENLNSPAMTVKKYFRIQILSINPTISRIISHHTESFAFRDETVC